MAQGFPGTGVICSVLFTGVMEHSVSSGVLDFDLQGTGGAFRIDRKLATIAPLLAASLVG